MKISYVCFLGVNGTVGTLNAYNMKTTNHTSRRKNIQRTHIQDSPRSNDPPPGGARVIHPAAALIARSSSLDVAINYPYMRKDQTQSAINSVWPEGAFLN